MPPQSFVHQEHSPSLAHARKATSISVLPAACHPILLFSTSPAIVPRIISHLSGLFYQTPMRETSSLVLRRCSSGCNLRRSVQRQAWRRKTTKRVGHFENSRGEYHRHAGFGRGLCSLEKRGKWKHSQEERSETITGHV
jgi:hypothetical protein